MRKAVKTHGNEVTMQLAEGAWTDNDAYKEGGSFAAPILKGCVVKLVTTADLMVTKSGAGETPIGIVVSAPMGTNTTNGRYATIRLFGRNIEEVELHTASDAIAVGGYVQFSTSGGKYSNGVWQKDGTANHTIALQSSSASGSIASGSLIAVLFGADLF